MKVYIAGPYTAETPEAVLDNVHAAIDAGVELIRRGHDPYIPHLSHWVEKRNQRETARHGFRLAYEDYLRLDEVWLRCCGGLLYLHPSAGANTELALAQELGLKVFFSLAEVPSAIVAVD